MKAEIVISGSGDPQKGADNEKQRLGNGGDHTDIDCTYRLGLSIQTGFGSICIRCDSMRKRRDDIG